MCSLSITSIGSWVRVILSLGIMDLLLFCDHTRNKVDFLKKKNLSPGLESLKPLPVCLSCCMMSVKDRCGCPDLYVYLGVLKNTYYYCTADVTKVLKDPWKRSQFPCWLGTPKGTKWTATMQTLQSCVLSYIVAFCLIWSTSQAKRFSCFYKHLIFKKMV